MSRDLLYPIRRLHGIIRRIMIKYRLKRDMQAQLAEKPDAVLLAMTPEHGNLGDHAIAWAVIKMLEVAGLEHIEISSKKLVRLEDLSLLGILNGRCIIVNGGGNLGTLWPGVENIFRSLITSAPNSRILLMPNTIYYEDSDWGREEFAASRRIYNAHANLQLCARERTSYEVMSAAYRDVKLFPDMVLSLNECHNRRARSGCLICLRGDVEKTLTDAQHDLIRSQAQALFGGNVRDTDTLAGHPVPPSARETELMGKFDEFSGAELVITDRLHGMIFCAVTGTPCIVVSSKSPKVRGCYDWIADLDYIRFADDPADITAEFAKIPAGPHTYDNSRFSRYFEELAGLMADFASNAG